MSFAKTARSAVIAIALAALAGTSMTTSAEARWRGHHGGAGLAFGIGALVVAGILASQHRRHHRHYYYSDSYYQPYYSYGYYGHRRHHRHHWRHRHW